MRDSQLQHYGILGMKWGVRRTPAQLARARGETPKTDSGSNRTNAGKSTKSSKVSSSSKKKLSEMSDAELQRQVNRLNLEKRYKELTPKEVSKGQKFVNHVLNQMVIPAATEVGKNFLKDYFTQTLKNATSKKKQS